MSDDTTIRMDNEQASGLLDMLHKINPYQMEQFEAVFAALVKARMKKDLRPNQFDADEDGEYHDPMVALCFQLWLNAKLNHMHDMEVRAGQIEKALESVLRDGPSNAIN